ncbi:MAG TPA: adenosylmethionine--8-amino-7-oxononanoate aminotransferase BioA, partial [Gammaproteobacteria bacterium]|nr:adenosylmethionine--8-amino-7-oxononanoate aminotransferase BioA [Gammaproteobacteria bacterium]MCH77670.1 adenosylmethionine--8-amino-7-oxononanoate aminotransferase BioA [Gammaproteobacteria bacterium]
TSNRVYDAFYGDYQNLTAFLHSHSYTGNALACAAALATLDIFEQDDTITANRALSEALRIATERFKDHPHVGDVRQTGMIVAIELAQDPKARKPFPWQERRGRRVYGYALEHGALLRPLGDVVYFMPPYVITPQQ